MPAIAKRESFTHWGRKHINDDPIVKIKLIRKGVESTVLVAAGHYYDVPRAKISKMVGLSSATADRKIKSRSLLGPIASERLLRLAAIQDMAGKVFGEEAVAREWLLRQNHALGDAPLYMLDTEAGAEEVKKILSSIAYGGAV